MGNVQQNYIRTVETHTGVCVARARARAHTNTHTHTHTLIGYITVSIKRQFLVSNNST